MSLTIKTEKALLTLVQSLAEQRGFSNGDVDRLLRMVSRLKEVRACARVERLLVGIANNSVTPTEDDKQDARMHLRNCHNCCRSESVKKLASNAGILRKQTFADVLKTPFRAGDRVRCAVKEGDGLTYGNIVWADPNSSLAAVLTYQDEVVLTLFDHLQKV